MKIQKASLKERDIVVALALELWPNHIMQELSDDLEKNLSNAQNAVFFAVVDDIPAGFAHCSLRYDYVEGTEKSPVGYLEGILVKEVYRRRGIASALLAACENWAKGEGCLEFASDCELHNEWSRLFHMGAGFREANRVICFAKKL